MGYNVKACSLGNIPNTGKSDCLNTLGAHVKVLLTLPDFEIDTLTNAKNEATWQEAIQERKVFPLWDVLGFENQSDDDGMFESSTGLRKIPTSQGNYQFEYHFVPPVFNMTSAYNFNGRRMRVVIIDGNNQVIGTTPDGTKFQGFDCYRVEVKKLIQAENLNEVARLPMVFELTKPSEYKEDLATFEASFAPDLQGLHDVDLAVVGSNPTTTDDEITVTVKRKSDESPVIGLVADDFVCYKDGVAFTISSATPSAFIAGQYLIDTAAVFAAAEYIVNLQEPDDMTTDGYQSTGAIEFTTE